MHPAGARRERGRPGVRRSAAFVEAGDPEAIDVYLCEQDAQRALDDCSEMSHKWRGLLRVEEVEFAGASLSENEHLT